MTCVASYINLINVYHFWHRNQRILFAVFVYNNLCYLRLERLFSLGTPGNEANKLLMGNGFKL